MNSKIIGRVARFIVNFCDWMNGYHGKMIEDVVVAVAFGLPTMFFFMWFMIVMS